MPQYQLVRCEIALAGDRSNTVVRGRFNPITYPELMMAQYLHGEEAVMDVHIVGTCDMTNEEMGQRLRLLYEDEYLKEMFPGARPRFPAGDPNLPVCTQPIYKAPPTRPDNPDPVLKPLRANYNPAEEVTLSEPVQPTVMAGDLDSMITADEIAAHRDDDDDMPLDELILGGGSNVPTVENLVTMPHVKAPGAHAPRQPDHLPDVAVPTYTQPENAKRAEHKGRGASR